MVTLGTVPRPLLVTIIAVLGFIITITLLAVAAFLFAASALAGTILSGILGSLGSFIVTLVGVVAGIIVLIAAIIEGLISWGLWAGKNWARILVMIAYALGALGAIGSVVAGVYSQVVPLIIYVLLIYYFTRPGVSAYFHRTSMPMQPQMQQPPSK